MFVFRPRFRSLDLQQFLNFQILLYYTLKQCNENGFEYSHEVGCGENYSVLSPKTEQALTRKRTVERFTVELSGRCEHHNSLVPHNFELFQ